MGKGGDGTNVAYKQPDLQLKRSNSFIDKIQNILDSQSKIKKVGQDLKVLKSIWFPAKPPSNASRTSSFVEIERERERGSSSIFSSSLFDIITILQCHHN